MDDMANTAALNDSRADAPVSRRRMLGKAVAAAAGVGAAASLLESTTAEAATVIPVTVGYQHDAQYQTAFRYGSPESSAATTPLIGGSEAMLKVDSTGVATPAPAVHGLAGALQSAIRGQGVGAGSIGGSFTGEAIGLQAAAGDGVGAYLYGLHIGASISGTIPLVIGPGHGAVGKPTGHHFPGAIAYDADGELYLCTAEGTPATFRKIAGPSAAGALHLLPAPVRVFDSRDHPPLGSAGGTKGVIANNGTRTIHCTANSTGVPTDATGLTFNLTIVGTTGGGNLTLWGNGAKPEATSINWNTTGAVLANQLTMSCGPSATLQVACNGGATASTHFIIDICGYYA